MRGTKVGENVTINYGMIDENVTIEDGVVIGDENSNKNSIALVGRGYTVKANSRIASGEIVEKK